MAAALEKNISTLTELNENILEDLSDEEIETEIAETDEYMFNLDLKNHQIEKLVNSKRSILNVNTYVLSHNVSSNSTSSGVDVITQPPMQKSETRRTQDSQPPPLIEIPSLIERSQNQSLQPTASNASTSSIQFQRLPKLTLPTFSGDLFEWQPFCDSFESSVHLNRNLSDIQKFNYLQAQLEGEAARTINGFSLTNSNYSKAIDLLRERFGQQHKIVQADMHTMLNLHVPSNSHASALLL